jgi:hypothetical protein
VGSRRRCSRRCTPAVGIGVGRYASAVAYEKNVTRTFASSRTGSRTNGFRAGSVTSRARDPASLAPASAAMVPGAAGPLRWSIVAITTPPGVSGLSDPGRSRGSKRNPSVALTGFSKSTLVWSTMVALAAGLCSFHTGPP